MIHSKLIASVFFLSVLTACGANVHIGNGKGDDTGTQPQTNPDRLNWAAVSSEFNPEVVDTSFRTDGIAKIDLHLFEFERDGSVIYSNAIPANTGLLKVYRVWKKSASWGRLLQTTTNDRRLKLEDEGEYMCSIRIQNGAITALEGGCYVRVELYLPIGSTIEAYNGEKLLTQRFIPVTNEEFLKSIDNAMRPEEKFAVLNDYLDSYTAIRSRASLTATQAGQAIGQFVWADDKFKALGLLNSTISDRENIGKMIDDKFSYFDREKARQIAGI
jgi:hypothetical protein